jgi:RimJ/RimL family protein N-acetyltransferase
LARSDRAESLRHAMQIQLRDCLLRPWNDSDAASLERYANNRRIWLNLRDGFPHPYTAEHAAQWIAKTREPSHMLLLAIDVGGEAVGSIGASRFDDVYKRSGEIGYWLGEPFWNRGIVTQAVEAFTELALRELEIVRLQAAVYGWNRASMRVLEKCGYVREGVLRKSVWKDGQLIDSVMYARLLE